MTCPVCKKENRTMVCPECGYDSSRDYGRYPTLGPVNRVPSASALHQDWLRTHPQPPKEPVVKPVILPPPPPPPPPPTPKPAPPKKKHPWLIIAVCALMLVLGIAIGTGLGSGTQEGSTLVGTWHMTAQDSLDQATYLMDFMELFDEEKALVDPNSLNYVLEVEFTADGRYTFAYDAEANKACVTEFYRGVMDALYEGRATLSELYETDLESMTREEFNRFYAEDVYGMESYETLIEELAANAYDYTVLDDPLETGTYMIEDATILCTVTGETLSESMGFDLNGNTLTLTYSDGIEIYTRVK